MSILLEEVDSRINQAIADRDLDALHQLQEELLKPAKQAPAAFAPAVELKPRAKRKMDLEAAEEGLVQDAALVIANKIARAERRVKYELKTIAGFAGLRIVSEGDSWFQYPIVLTDIIDLLSDDADKAILSLDAAGDEVSQMIDQAEYGPAIERTRAQVFLFSGGGNDLLGEGRFAGVLKSFRNGASAGELIDEPAMHKRLDEIVGGYRRIVADVASQQPDIHIFGHGYDLSFPMRGGKWFGKPLETRGIPLDVGRQMVGIILDAFNDKLADLAHDLANFHHVDLRGKVDRGAASWYDELHPKDPGYARAADVFRKAIADARPKYRESVTEGWRAGLEAIGRPAEASWSITSGGRDHEAHHEAPCHTCESVTSASEASKPPVDRLETTAQKSSRNGTRIDHIVIHYTTSRSIDGTISWFKSGPPGHRVSAHYIVGRDGKLVQMVSDSDAAWHAGPMNARSIGIEHVAKRGDEIMAAQAATSYRLISWLMQEYDIDRAALIPHCCVKSTDCCGDLFRRFGGGADKSCREQTAALHAWLDSMAAGGHEERQADDGRAESFLEAMTRPLSRRDLADASFDVDEWSEVQTLPGPGLIDVIGDERAARRAIAEAFEGVDTDGFDHAEFSAFVHDLGLKHFIAAELLFPGAANASGKCRGLNTLPPRKLWPNIAATARMLDQIREKLGAPVEILSCYRSPAYNACISGAGMSQHVRFNAIDWRCTKGEPADWRVIARTVRASRREFLGGIGFYPRQRFIHIDTRGHEANW